MSVERTRPATTAALLIAVLSSPATLAAADGVLDPGFWGDGRMNFSSAYDGDFTVGRTLVAPDEAFVVVARRVPTSAPEAFFWQRFTASALSTQCNFVPPGGATAVKRAVATFDVAGRLLVGGTVTYGDERFVVARFLYPSCTLDTSFDGDGYATFDLVPATSEWAEAIDTDALGRVYLAGYAGFPDVDVLVLRLEVTGALDPTFSGNGWLKLDTLGLTISDAAFAITVQADGKPVLAGATDDGGADDAFALRLTQAGVPDNTFDGDGVVTVSFDLGGSGDQADDFAWDIAYDADRGRLALGGQTFSPSNGAAFAAVAILTSSGALDPGFSGDGRFTFQFASGSPSSAAASQFDGRGRLVVAGSASVGGQNDFGIARLLTTFSPNGTLDDAFNADGRLTVPFDLAGSDLADSAASLALASGRPLVGGVARHSDGNDRPAFVRLESALLFADGFDTGTTLGWLHWY